MSCTCYQPIRPEFKDSYKDLLDKPQINGVTLSGNLTAADLGIKAGAQFKIVPQLPVTDIDEATIYLVPVQVGQTNNIYQEWIYINNKWEKIGEPISIEGGGGTVGITGRYVQLTFGNFPLISIDFFNQFSDLNLEDGKIYIAYKGQDHGITFKGEGIYDLLSSFNGTTTSIYLGAAHGTNAVSFDGLIYTICGIVFFIGEFSELR
jgi:hypothetical protein